MNGRSRRLRCAVSVLVLSLVAVPVVVTMVVHDRLLPLRRQWFWSEEILIQIRFSRRCALWSFRWFILVNGPGCILGEL
jgi:hypothetical protein